MERQLKESPITWTSSLQGTRRWDVVLARLRLGHTQITRGHYMSLGPRPLYTRCETRLTVRHIPTVLGSPPPAPGGFPLYLRHNPHTDFSPSLGTLPIFVATGESFFDRLHSYTNTHTYTHNVTLTQARILSLSHKHTHILTLTQTYTHTHTLSCKHIYCHFDTHTHKHTHTNIHTNTHTQTHTRKHTQTYTHKHIHTHKHTHTNTNIQTHTHTHTHKHNNTHKHTHTQTRTHKHTHNTSTRENRHTCITQFHEL